MLCLIVRKSLLTTATVSPSGHIDNCTLLVLRTLIAQARNHCEGSCHLVNFYTSFLPLNNFLGPKPMQDSWGNGEDMGHWDADEGDMWNSPTSQESSSSCNSLGNGPKKVPNKVRKHNLTLYSERSY